MIIDPCVTFYPESHYGTEEETQEQLTVTQLQVCIDLKAKKKKLEEIYNQFSENFTKTTGEV